MIWECNLLMKFLFKRCSESEITLVNSWLDESEHNKQTLQFLRVQMGSDQDC